MSDISRRVGVSPWNNSLFKLLYQMSTYYSDNSSGTSCLYSVASTSMQRHDVASTLIQRCINVMCPLRRYK